MIRKCSVKSSESFVQAEPRLWDLSNACLTWFAVTSTLRQFDSLSENKCYLPSLMKIGCGVNESVTYRNTVYTSVDKYIDTSAKKFTS